MFGEIGGDTGQQLDEGQQETKARKPTQEERILEEFRQGYKGEFGVYPIITESNGYYRVKGYPDGMSIKRLRALTTQYRNRKNLKE